jgi:hypothetical protein
MPEFGSMADKAKQAAGEHSEQVEKATDKASQEAGERFGHEEQFDEAGEKADDYLTGGQQNQGGQGQGGQGGQGQGGQQNQG